VTAKRSHRLLPEWAPQSAVLLTWPHADSDWRGSLEAIEADYIALAAAIAVREPLLVACRDIDHIDHVTARLHAAGIPAPQRHLLAIPSDDTWVRDYGPLAVGDGNDVGLVAFRFNAWGGKYPHDDDARFCARLQASGALGGGAFHHDPTVIEGGALETDGLGTLLTTANCLDSASRNGDLGRDGIAARLEVRLGITLIHWLEVEPLAGDDTDGHIDTVARFCAPDLLAYVTCDDPGDPHHASLAGLARQLDELRTPIGRPYRRVALPSPAPLHSHDDGRRLAATYANFLIINGAVLCPNYGDPADATAHARLGEAFPDREIVAVPARALIEQNGSLHCATLQLPAGLAINPAARHGGNGKR